MGNEQSSQRVSEPRAPKLTTQKPWSPDDISVSSDEDRPTTARSVPLSDDPEPPSNPTQTSLARRKQRKSRSASETSSINDVPGSTAASGEADTLVAVTDNKRRSSRQTKTNKFEQREDGVVYPPIDGASDKDQAGAVQQAEDGIEVAIDAGLSQAQLPTDNTRLPCPHANTYDCNKTFATQKSAKRHAEMHLNPNKFSCVVCHRTFSRSDTLESHKKSHSRQEINEALELAERQLEVGKGGDSEPAEGVVSDTRNDEPEEHAPNLRDDLQQIPESVPSMTKTNPENITTPVAVDQSSSRETASSASIFDQPANTEIVQETPRPKSRLKRKRDTPTTNQATASPAKTSRKRRRRHSLSPPTSVTSEEELVQVDGNDSDGSHSLATIPAPKFVRTESVKTGNLDAFARPWTPGSQLYHPIHNPRSPRVASSQRVQIIVPRSSQAGPSSKAMRTQTTLRKQTSEDQGEDQTPLAAKARAMVYSTPKGKRKAETGVTYSSPPQRTAGAHKNDTLEPGGMATSVARKGASKASSRKRLRQEDDDGEQSNSETELHPKADVNAEHPFTCQECGRRFSTKDGLQKHTKRPNVHSKKSVCEDCSKIFSSYEKLKAHRCTANEGEGSVDTGRKGAFTPAEVRKVQKWRDNFCHDNDINVATFNQMMTDTSRRAKGFVWPYRFATKDDFLREYYEVLPDRDRRSMRRYRERALQNVPEKQEWTEEDDAELVALVKEIGPKWVEIGQRMTRTQDSVNQRWRFKLQYRGKIHEGDWLQSEEARLKEAVTQVKRESGLSLDPNSNVRMPWESVSKKLKGTRSARQCSNKWRLMLYERKGNRFIKPSDADEQVETPTSTTTPSKMSQRLAGQTPSSKGQASSSKKHVSEKFVQESDGASDSDAQEKTSSASTTDSDDNPAKTDGGKAHEDGQQLRTKGRADAETPASRRNPLATRTPQTENSLSQTFAQTQANTSALRAPDTTRKPHTQTEIPTPGIPIQTRPESSPWLAVNSQSQEDDENDDIMAEPVSSDVETDPAPAARQNNAVRESLKQSSSGSNEEEEVRSNSNGRSESTSSDESQSDHSSDSDAEGYDSDAMVEGAQKDTFIQSLKSPSNKLTSSSQPNRSSAQRKSLTEEHWAKLIRGETSTIPADSQTDSEDEGDIMHH